MAGRFVVDGANTTIIFEYTQITTKMSAFVTDCAEYLWNRGYGDHGTPAIPKLFSDLTNQQKLNLVDQYFRRSGLDSANNNKSLKAQNAARAVEEANLYNF
jgi:hypothetical protein